MNSFGLTILIFLIIVTTSCAGFIVYLFFRLRKSERDLNSIRNSFKVKLARSREKSIALEKAIIGYWRYNITQMHQPLNHIKYQDNFFDSKEVKNTCYNYYQQSFLVRVLETLTSDLSVYRSSQSQVGQIAERLLEAYATVIQRHQVEVITSFDKDLFVNVDPVLLEKLLNYLLFTAFKHPKKDKKMTFEISRRDDKCEIEVFFVGHFQAASWGQMIHWTKLSPLIPDKFCALAMIKIVESMGGRLLSSELNHFSVVTIRLPLASSGARSGSGYSINYDEIQREVSLLNAMELSSEDSELEDDQLLKPCALVFSRRQEVFDKMESQLGDKFHVKTFRFMDATPKTMTFADTITYLKQAKDLLPDVIFIDQQKDDDCDALHQALKNELLTSHIPRFSLTDKAVGAAQSEELAEQSTSLYSYLSPNLSKKELELVVRQQLIRGQKIKAAWQEKPHAPSEQENENLPSLEQMDDLSREFLSTVHQLLEKQFADSALDADTLAQSCSLSRLDFERKLKALTYLSYEEHIRIFRLKKAKAFLLAGETLSSLHSRTGYSNEDDLVRDFTEMFELSPDDIVEARTFSHSNSVQKQLT